MFRRIPMKKLALAMFFTCFAQPGYAQDFAAPAQPRRVPTPEPRKTPVILGRQVGGVIPRAIRSRNPAQMLNPRAPASYGTAEQNVTYKPDGSGRWNGIKLFSIEF